MDKKKAEWSNEPMFEPTPREVKLAELAEKDRAEVKPQSYDITSTTSKAMRVIHDYDGNKIAILPGDTKRGILLRPNTAEYLGRTGLTLTAA